MTALAELLAEHVTRPCPESDTRARDHLIDWLACVAGARGSAVHQAARNLPDSLKRAALLGNLLEMDDVHRVGRLHPGPVIWPAVLMALPAGGPLIPAAMAGYEAMILFGETLDDRHYAHWHPTATAGIVGAAAAASVARGLSVEATGWAIGHAASLAGGLWHMRHGNSMTKQVHVLHAARSGIECARLAEAGLTGAVGMIEGPQGLYNAMCDKPRAMRFPDGWRIEEVSFKPWAACRHAHPAIDAALELGNVAGEVLVETYADAIAFCDRPDPKTPAEARFSIQHAVAVAMTCGAVFSGDFEPSAIERFVSSRGRVRVVESGEFTARYPAHFGARVSGGGRAVERIDTLGDPERPLPPEALADKLATLCAWGGLGDDEQATAMAAAIGGPHAVIDLLERWMR